MVSVFDTRYNTRSLSSGGFDGGSPSPLPGSVREPNTDFDSASTIPITADHREREADCLERLQRDVRFDVSMEQLPVGDYRIGNQLLIERKTARDFVDSIVSDRLFRQCRRMRERTVPCVLLLEGDPYETEREIHPSAVRGALVSVSVFWCIPVLRTASVAESFSVFLLIGQQYTRSVKYLNQRSSYGRRNRSSRQVHVLQGLPGVGSHRAKKLLDRFGTVQAVMQASLDDLQQVDDVGEKTARKIKRILEAPWEGDSS